MPNNVVQVQVQGLFGATFYERLSSSGEPGGPPALRLPFSDITPTIR